MKNGEAVQAFERAFAEYVGAKYAIALCNGTATLHTALMALELPPGGLVAVPPLTMASTTLAVLHAGLTPVYMDVDPRTWLMMPTDRVPSIPVSLYGLHQPMTGPDVIDDAAQTLRPHNGCAFTSYSFQASKILPLGEGGMLVTDDEELAVKAREYSSLGYRMKAKRPRIDVRELKSPDAVRHYRLGYNYRMSDHVAQVGYEDLVDDPQWPDELRLRRKDCVAMYREAVYGCDWLVPQYVPPGWGHDWWAFTVVIGNPTIPTVFTWADLADAIETHGGERPYGAWRLTYQEPALRSLAADGACPIAEDLQPRLMQFQTNNPRSAESNARALRMAIEELG